MKTITAMYLRLSRDDGENQESNSISNQRELIRSYCKERGIEIYGEYVDDGISGATFDRPSFKTMIKDMKEGKFNAITVKDLSRFGRDYIESGKYIQKILPEHNIRFISITDNYDSASADANDTHLILPIRNFINDSYCRDISMKVKSSQKTKRKKGQFIGAFAPFGYKKNPRDKHQLIIDRKVSHIVELIFYMKIDGYSSQAIANHLNDIGAPTPSKHKEDTQNVQMGFVPIENKWQAKMINRILTNRVYIGILEQGKVTKLNYKSSKRIAVDEDDWIVVKDAHEAIVSKATFEIANNLMLRDISNRKGKPSMLAGMLFCKDCGSQMIRRKVKYKGKTTNHYVCRNYNTTGECSRHGIREDKILESIEQVFDNFLNVNQVLQEKVENVDFSELDFNGEFDSLYAEKKKYETLRQSLFMDLEDDLINEDEFQRYRRIYAGKVLEVEQQIKNKKEMIDELKENLSSNEWIVDLSNFDGKAINRRTIAFHIDKIEVHENGSLEITLYDTNKLSFLRSLVERYRENKVNVIPIHSLKAVAVNG